RLDQLAGRCYPHHVGPVGSPQRRATRRGGLPDFRSRCGAAFAKRGSIPRRQGYRGDRCGYPPTPTCDYDGALPEYHPRQHLHLGARQLRGKSFDYPASRVTANSRGRGQLVLASAAVLLAAADTYVVVLALTAMMVDLRISID